MSCQLQGQLSGTEQSALVKKVWEEAIPFADNIAAINCPFFDRESKLQWDRTPLRTLPDNICPEPSSLGGEAVAMAQKVRLRTPYVAEVKCRKPDGAPGTELVLAGFDPTGQLKWKRRLGFLSGPRQIDQWLIGAAADGLVTSSLEVWSPETGENIVSAATHKVGTGAEARPVPYYHFTYAALYDARRRQFYVFEANVSLTKREGGIYRLNPQTKEKDLLYGVVATALGTYDHVEAMELSLDGKYLLLAQRQAVRGPQSVSLLLFDLEQRTPIYLSRFGEGESCSSPQVVVGLHGNVAFAYRNESRRQHHLIHFQIPAGT